MKNLIRKILKENNESENFEWAKDIDPSDLESELMSKYQKLSNYNFHGQDFYALLVESGVHSYEKFMEIYDFMDTEIEEVWDDGRESGLDDCACDGCCDDYYSYEYVEEQKEEAFEDGKNEAIEEYESRIEDYESEIAELKYQIEKLKNKEE